MPANTNEPRDLDLERFVDSDEKLRELNHVVPACIVAGSYHGISLIFGYFAYQYSWRVFMLPTHAFLLAAILVVLRLDLKVGDRRLIAVNSLEFILMLGFGVSTFLSRITPGIPKITVATG